MITKEQIIKASESLNAAKSKLKELREQRALEQCPFEIGQIVDICGYSFKGKKMKITSIGAPKYEFNGDWEVQGDVLKKDGTVGAQYTSFGERHYKGEDILA